jgi:antitoxin CptB
VDAAAQAERGKLRWRCRRGMKELDLLLAGWLDTRWAAADPAERGAFARFLELPDPDIAGYLLRDEEAVPAEFDSLVRQLRQLLRARGT